MTDITQAAVDLSRQAIYMATEYEDALTTLMYGHDFTLQQAYDLLFEFLFLRPSWVVAAVNANMVYQEIEL